MFLNRRKWKFNLEGKCKVKTKRSVVSKAISIIKTSYIDNEGETTAEYGSPLEIENVYNSISLTKRCDVYLLP